jgi:hypothetical protein
VIVGWYLLLKPLKNHPEANKALLLGRGALITVTPRGTRFSTLPAGNPIQGATGLVPLIINVQVLYALLGNKGFKYAAMGMQLSKCKNCFTVGGLNC